MRSKCDGARAETRFRLSAKRTSPFKSARASDDMCSAHSTAGSRGVRISGSNAGYTIFRGSVKGTGYPLHSPVSPSLSHLVRHRVPSHFNWTLTTHKLRAMSNTANGAGAPRERRGDNRSSAKLIYEYKNVWDGFTCACAAHLADVQKTTQIGIYRISRRTWAFRKKTRLFPFFMVYCLSHYSGNTTSITIFLVDMLQFF